MSTDKTQSKNSSIIFGKSAIINKSFKFTKLKEILKGSQRKHKIQMFKFMMFQIKKYLECGSIVLFIAFIIKI